MNFLLYGPVLPSVILCTTYRPMAPFTSMSLTSVTVSCMTCGPASPAAYTNFLLHGPVLLSHLVYNLWACSTLYVKPHIRLAYNSQACIALIHVFIYLFCGLVLPSVVLHTTYRPTSPLYHEHIWQAHDALINFWNPLNITAEVYSGHCLQADLFHPWLQSCTLQHKPTCFLDSGTNNLQLP